MPSPTTTLLTALLTLLPTTTLAASRPEYHPGQPRPRPSNARLLAAQAIPTPNLKSDFKKNNVTAAWAPGYPKIWSQSDKSFTIGWDTVPRVGSAFSPNGEFVVLTNDTDSDVIRVETGVKVSSFKNLYFAPWAGLYTAVSGVPGSSEFDFLVAGQNFTEEGSVSRISIQRISAEGKPVGDVVERQGVFGTGYAPALETNAEGERILIAYADNRDVLVYNLDDLAREPVALRGHVESVLSAVVSPDKKRIASTGFDGYVKLWDASSGELVLDIPPTDPSNAPYNQNWVTRFSPDGKNLLYSIGSPEPEIKITPLADPTNTISIGKYDYWVRAIEYSPSGTYIAIGGFDWLRIVRTSDYTVVQEWAVDYGDIWLVAEILNLHWFDGEKRLRWSYQSGSEMYDFETNLKYRWGPGEGDQTSPENWWTVSTEWYPFKGEGWFGNHDSDLRVRVWDLPA